MAPAAWARSIARDDTKLGRDVALKILPDAFAADPDRLARFEREARTLASLNHPHIAQIYGLEEADGAHALVMELVEGDDLSARIARGPVPLDDALPIARQIADALEAAHEQGIIHRDLKPANIKLRPDGTVEGARFRARQGAGPGRFARAIRDLANSPTITSPALTMRGVILGTAAYMAPEQAKGKPVDKRADIWAFGCVLYEMLTGSASVRRRRRHRHDRRRGHRRIRTGRSSRPATPASVIRRCCGAAWSRTVTAAA